MYLSSWPEGPKKVVWDNVLFFFNGPPLSSLQVHEMMGLYFLLLLPLGFPGSSDSRESTCNVGDLGLPLGWEDLLEEGTAMHSSILAWRIPWTEEPGGLQSMGLQRVGHDWVTKHSTAIAIVLHKRQLCEAQVWIFLLKLSFCALCIKSFSVVFWCVRPSMESLALWKWRKPSEYWHGTIELQAYSSCNAVCLWS